MLTTGMDIESIRNQFDIPRLNALNSYTERYPPQHILIAGYFGFGKDKSKITSEDDVAALLNSIPMVPK